MTGPAVRTPDVVAAGRLAGGASRAVDALLVSRLEGGRVRVVEGQVEGVRLRREDPLDGALLDALGARGRRDVETVRWRASRDRRLAAVADGLAADGLLGGRTRLGRRATPERPAPTAAGRRLLADLRRSPERGGAWELALGGRGALTDPTLREALRTPARPPLPRVPRHERVEPHVGEIHYTAGGGDGGSG